MSASQPPSNPLDEIKSHLAESPPHEELQAGIADKSPLLENNKPRYAVGWFDKWLLAIPLLLVLALCGIAWVSCNPATNIPSAPTAPAAVTNISLNAPSGGTTAIVGQPIMLNGQAPPASQVQLLNHAQVIATTTADANGNYEFNLTPTQPGVYELQTVTTINGQPVTSPSITITVTDSAPNATSVASGVNATTAPNATAETNATSGASVTAIPNATAETNATSGVSVTAIPNATAETNATSGVSVTAIPNATAETNATSSANATTAPNATAETNVTPDASVTAIPNATAETNATPNGNATTISSATSAVQIISLEMSAIPGTVTVGQPIHLFGIAPPGATVQLYNHGSFVATTTADANGKYQFDVRPTAAGEYELQTVTIVNGQQVSSAAITIVVAQAGTSATPPVGATPGANGTAVSVANATGTPLAQATPGAGGGGNVGGDNANVNPPTVNLGAAGFVPLGAGLTGTASPNSHIVIYFNDQAVGSADADAGGAWQFIVPETVAPGAYTLTVVVTDANGKPISAASEKQTVHIAPKPLLPVTGGDFQ